MHALQRVVSRARLMLLLVLCFDVVSLISIMVSSADPSRARCDWF
jgi:hypothetical protein